jgi:hypothetical protein
VVSLVLYLLDANTLIDAKRDYFEFDRVPEFWEWLVHQGASGKIKIPIEVYEEFEEARNSDGTRDQLAEWAARSDVKEALLLDEEVSIELLATVTYEGYCNDPTDLEIEKMGRDPFLIAHALANQGNRIIVTTEVSKPKKERANRKVPDVCKVFGIKTINNFQLLRELDFTTNWKR